MPVMYLRIGIYENNSTLTTVCTFSPVLLLADEESQLSPGAYYIACGVYGIMNALT